MKSKIIVPAIVYGLFTATNVTASEYNLAMALAPTTVNNKHLLLSKTSSRTTDSGYSSTESLSPREKNSLSPGQRALDLLLNDTNFEEEEDKSTSSTNVIAGFFKNNPFLDQMPRYSLINVNGSLDTEIILTNEARNDHKNRYLARLISKNNQFFVEATHIITTEQGAQPLTQKEHFSVPAILTDEQRATIMQKSLYKIFAIDDANNSYCISNDNDSTEKFDSFSDTEDELSHPNDEGYSRQLTEQKEDSLATQNKSLPTPKTVVTCENILRDIKCCYTAHSITHNSDASTTITYHDHSHVLQSIITFEPIDSANYLLVHVYSQYNPLGQQPFAIALSKKESSTDQEKKDISQKSTAKNNQSKKINNGSNHTRTAIGGLTFIAILLMLYKYDKMPHFTELFNNLLSRIQNFAQ